MRSNRLTGYLALAVTIALSSSARAQEGGAEEQPPAADEQQPAAPEAKKSVAQAEEPAPATDQHLPEDLLRKMIQEEMAKGITPKVGDVHMHGYFRAGYGVSSEGGRQICFQAPGASAKWRLGNECDTYGEFLFSGPAYVGDNGVVANANVMFNVYIPQVSHGYPDRFTPNFNELGKDIHWGTNQFYFDFSGLPFLGKDAKAWIGRRFYKRENTDVIDYFWWNASGLGGGIEDIPVSGPMKVSFATFVVSGPNAPVDPAVPNSPTLPLRSDVGLNPDVRLYGIPLHPGGELIIGADAVIDASDGDSPNDTQNGISGTAIYVLQALGGSNKLAVQYGQGPSASGNGVFGSLTDDKDRKMIRVLDNLNIQPTPELGATISGLYQHDEFPGDAPKLDWISAGGRLTYALAENAQMLFELGFDTAKFENADRATLTKVTIAPAITGGKGLWARPHLRLFATAAFFNDAARAGGVDGGAGVYAATDKSAGFSFGMQSEGWW
jgi:maltoporin